MLLKFEFFVALRYLRSKRKEKFISITALFSFLGIALGVATLIVVMSVMNGFRKELVSKILGINAHITIMPKQDSIYKYEEMIKYINDNFDKSIKSINPIVETQAMIVGNGKSAGTMVKGMRLADIKIKDDVYRHISAFDLDSFDEGNGVIIGANLAMALDVNIGDTVKIIAPEVSSTIAGIIPRTKTYDVLGTFRSGVYEYDAGAIFMPMAKAQLQFRYRDAVSGLELMLDNPEESAFLALSLQRSLSDAGFSVNIVDWKNANASFINALNVERNVMFLILTLIIIVAVFNIISSLVMLVTDKSKQIALMRTMGATRGSILRIFCICGSFIGFVGTALGVALGSILASNIENIRQFIESHFDSNLFDPAIYFLSQLPSVVYASDVIGIAIMSLLLSFLATIYPALKASRTNPVEVLRYE